MALDIQRRTLLQKFTRSVITDPEHYSDGDQMNIYVELLSGDGPLEVRVQQVVRYWPLAHRRAWKTIASGSIQIDSDGPGFLLKTILEGVSPLLPEDQPVLRFEIKPRDAHSSDYEFKLRSGKR